MSNVQQGMSNVQVVDALDHSTFDIEQPQTASAGPTCTLDISCWTLDIIFSLCWLFLQLWFPQGWTTSCLQPNPAHTGPK